MIAAASQGRVPGPVDRESFFDEQRRNRDAARRYAWLCYLLVAAMCAAMSVLLGPLLFAILGLVVDVVNLVIPMPNVLGALFDYLDPIIDGLDQPGGTHGLLALAAWSAAPGLILLGALWLGLSTLFHRAGVFGVLGALRVRAPDLADPEEKQLVNVVEEMAVAAGIEPPRVMLVDGAGINCGALGTDVDDAVVLVSRPLLERFDRDETQGVVAHLVASVANGDMRVGILMISVMQMLSALSALIHSPVDREARKLLWQLLRLAARPAMSWSTTDDATREVVVLAEVLANPFHARHSGPGDGNMNRWVALLSFPAVVVDLIFSKMFTLFFLTPVLGLLWRRRKYLADAAAVQLTRNPDGLAQALVRSQRDERGIPGGDWAAHMFVFDARDMTGPVTDVPTGDPRSGEALKLGSVLGHLKAAYAHDAGSEAESVARRAQRERIRELMRRADADTSRGGGLVGSGTVAFLPGSARRIERLRAMGAHVSSPGRTALQLSWQMWLLVAALALVLACLLGALFVLGTWLVLMLSMLVVALPTGALHVLLRWLAG
jgi:Zn-dependent protease with chaperone function